MRARVMLDAAGFPLSAKMRRRVAHGRDAIAHGLPLISVALILSRFSSFILHDADFILVAPRQRSFGSPLPLCQSAAAQWYCRRAKAVKMGCDFMALAWRRSFDISLIAFSMLTPCSVLAYFGEARFD